ncbi:glycoside hydrolase family 43 protein [Nucisporomicrobium flavum]|uniref:glycoside hydrolase family 43 protein n=1 Tax=Nucisporomicrobium flavum TaxID=2785915 RepID=UPI0018F4C1BA|nr:glycoside hydrolase family 43 protein [Nucisporomicrobium flavum]
MVRTRVALMSLLLLAGCSSGSSAAPEEAPVVKTFTNPVFLENFPDPGAILVDGTWYAYGTNDATRNVPILTSPDLVTWTPAGDALPAVGTWAERGNTWAPEVIAGDGGYLLYYTARSTAAGRQCIGVAFSKTPQGPFVDDSAEPLICQADEGGSIDASPYRDPGGDLYLYWKNDGNAIGQPTYLYGSRLSDDGRKLTGKTVRLLVNDAAWEDHVIEAPQMVAHDGKLYLFYSANAFDRDVYAMGYAECDGPLGPCRKAAENPILTSSPAAAGPGHSFLVTTPAGETWLLYHAWPPEAIGSVAPGRQLWLDRVDWTAGRPAVHGPTAEPQPLPR